MALALDQTLALMFYKLNVSNNNILITCSLCIIYNHYAIYSDTPPLDFLLFGDLPFGELPPGDLRLFGLVLLDASNASKTSPLLLRAQPLPPLLWVPTRYLPQMYQSLPLEQHPNHHHQL